MEVIARIAEEKYLKYKIVENYSEAVKKLIEENCAGIIERAYGL